MSSTLIGFTGDSIIPLEMTALPVTLGQEPRSKTLWVTFMVVGLPTAYNIILEWPTLNKLRAVVSTYHHAIKFPTRAELWALSLFPSPPERLRLVRSSLRRLCSRFPLRPHRARSASALLLA
ncbi:hypothetical protein GW17_00017263 [Ensete ventricosum]|nr:hypothetical protein GW17_00017263 [Ensete ventricosum]